MDQIIKTNTATTSTFLNTSEVLEEQWKTAKQTIRDKIASTAQSQARRMLEEEIGPEQLCEELSKLRLDYVSINVTENEARDKMSQNYIEAMMKNMGQVTGRITARELNLKNDVLQMLNDELQKQNDALKNQILEQENARKKDIIKLRNQIKKKQEQVMDYINTKHGISKESVIKGMNQQNVKKCHDQQLT